MLLKELVFLLGILLFLIVLISISLTFSKEEESWCNKELNAGDCELYAEDGTCYCIDKISLYTTDYYGSSQTSCERLHGYLATPNNNDKLKWLAKRLYFMGVNNAIVGLQKLDSLWYWMKPQGQLRATDLLWREDVEQIQEHSHASIDVRAIMVEKDDIYNGYISYNYDYYIDYNSNFQWYGLVTTNNTNNGDERYYICHYTNKSTSATKHILGGNVQEFRKVNMENELYEGPGNDHEITTTKNPEPGNVATNDQESCECGHSAPIDLVKMGESKVICSPGYPKGYSYNQDCGWVVKVDGGLAIRLQWIAFNTEDQMDFVFVYDSESEDFSKLLEICTGTACANIVSSGQSMFVHFTSDHVTQDIGFKALVSAVDADECYCKMLEEISLVSSDESYSFTSPGYPNGHCENQNCNWIIRGPDNHGLHISWNEFSLAANSTITLHDGITIKNICSGTHCNEFVTEDKELLIDFWSGSQREASVGFSALVKSVQNYCNKNDLVSPGQGSIIFTKEKDDGSIAVEGTATLKCPDNFKIAHTQSETTDFVVCNSPHWDRQFVPCIRVCLAQFSSVTQDSVFLNMCQFGNIDQSSLVPMGQMQTVNQYDLITKQQIATLDYTCTTTGWSPDTPPVCAKMIETILLIDPYGLRLYTPNNKDNSIELELPFTDGYTGHASALTSDGNVIVMGGNGRPDNTQLFEYLNTSWIINLNLWQVSPGPNTNIGRLHPSSATLNGVVYVCGGGQSNIQKEIKTCDVYDGFGWKMAPGQLLSEHLGCEMVALNGSLYVMGGYLYIYEQGLNLVEKYSVESGEWQLVTPMLQGRLFFASSVLNGIIFVCGGLETLGSHHEFSSCEQYVDCGDVECDFVDSKMWKIVANMNQNRHSFAMVAFGGKLFALGGMSILDGSVELPHAESVNTAESYDPNRNQWIMEELEMEMSHPRGPIYGNSPTAVVIRIMDGLLKFY